MKTPEQESSARRAMLAKHGLVECADCKSWVYPTPTAVKFHYRRCQG